MGVVDNEDALTNIKNLQSFGFHKIENNRISLLKASDRIFRYTDLEIPKANKEEEE